MSGEEREHLVYADADGNVEEPAECIETCPGCHYDGNTDCEYGPGNCDICDGTCDPSIPEVVIR